MAARRIPGQPYEFDNETGIVFDLDEAEPDDDPDDPPWTEDGWRPPAPATVQSLIGSASGWPISADGQRIDFPDFLRPDYPFDLPPNRLPFAQHVFSLAGAPELCPQRGCRRSGRCAGGEGPPCLRADPDLRLVLKLWFMMTIDMIDEPQYWRSLKARRNRYAQFAPAQTAPKERKRR